MAKSEKRNLFEVTPVGCLNPKSELNLPQASVLGDRIEWFDRLNAAEAECSRGKELCGQEAGTGFYQVGVGTVRPVFPRAAAAACSRKDP